MHRRKSNSTWQLEIEIHWHIFPIFFSPFEFSPFSCILQSFFNTSSNRRILFGPSEAFWKKYTVLNLPAIKQYFWETEPCWRLSHADGAAADSVKFEPKKVSMVEKLKKNKQVYIYLDLRSPALRVWGTGLLIPNFVKNLNVFVET